MERHHLTPHSHGAVAALGTLAATVVLVAGGVLVVTSADDAAGAQPGPARPKPTRTPTATPTPTPTPPPSPSPTPPTSPSTLPSPGGACAAYTSWGETSYCVVPAVDALVDGTHPAGTALAAPSVYAGGLSGRTVTLTSPAACPPGTYCGALFVDATVTFADDARLPAYGEAVDVYGVTTASGFTVTYSTLVLPCEYGLGCA